MGNLSDRRLFVSNMDFRMSVGMLRLEFGRYGQITDIFLPEPKFEVVDENYQNGGFGFVEYEHSESCEIAIKQLNGKLDAYFSRELKVELAREKP